MSERSEFTKLWWTIDPGEHLEEVVGGMPAENINENGLRAYIPENQWNDALAQMCLNPDITCREARSISIPPEERIPHETIFTPLLVDACVVSDKNAQPAVREQVGRKYAQRIVEDPDYLHTLTNDVMDASNGVASENIRVQRGLRDLVLPTSLESYAREAGQSMVSKVQEVELFYRGAEKRLSETDLTPREREERLLLTIEVRRRYLQVLKEESRRIARFAELASLSVVSNDVVQEAAFAGCKWAQDVIQVARDDALQEVILRDMTGVIPQVKSALKESSGVEVRQENGSAREVNHSFIDKFLIAAETRGIVPAIRRFPGIGEVVLEIASQDPSLHFNDEISLYEALQDRTDVRPVICDRKYMPHYEKALHATRRQDKDELLREAISASTAREVLIGMITGCKSQEDIISLFTLFTLGAFEISDDIEAQGVLLDSIAGLHSDHRRVGGQMQLFYAAVHSDCDAVIGTCFDIREAGIFLSQGLGRFRTANDIEMNINAGLYKEAVRYIFEGELFRRFIPLFDRVIQSHKDNGEAEGAREIRAELLAARGKGGSLGEAVCGVDTERIIRLAAKGIDQAKRAEFKQVALANLSVDALLMLANTITGRSARVVASDVLRLKHADRRLKRIIAILQLLGELDQSEVREVDARSMLDSNNRLLVLPFSSTPIKDRYYDYYLRTNNSVVASTEKGRIHLFHLPHGLIHAYVCTTDLVPAQQAKDMRDVYLRTITEDIQGPVAVWRGRQATTAFEYVREHGFGPWQRQKLQRGIDANTEALRADREKRSITPDGVVGVVDDTLLNGFGIRRISIKPRKVMRHIGGINNVVFDDSRYSATVTLHAGETECSVMFGIDDDYNVVGADFRSLRLSDEACVYWKSLITEMLRRILVVDKRLCERPDGEETDGVQFEGVIDEDRKRRPCKRLMVSGYNPTSDAIDLARSAEYAKWGVDIEWLNNTQSKWGIDLSNPVWSDDHPDFNFQNKVGAQYWSLTQAVIDILHANSDRDLTVREVVRFLDTQSFPGFTFHDDFDALDECACTLYREVLDPLGSAGVLLFRKYTFDKGVKLDGSEDEDSPALCTLINLSSPVQRAMER